MAFILRKLQIRDHKQKRTEQTQGVAQRQSIRLGFNLQHCKKKVLNQYLLKKSPACTAAMARSSSFFDP